MKKISKLSGVLLLIVAVYPFKSVRGQTGAEAATAIAVARGVLEVGAEIYGAIDWIEGNWWHDWAMCEFRDGFRIYNRFKRKRFRNGMREVIEYFTGQNQGDCDSWFVDYDSKPTHVCMPRDLDDLVYEHGPIKRIMAINNPQEWEPALRKPTSSNLTSDQKDYGKKW